MTRPEKRVDGRRGAGWRGGCGEERCSVGAQGFRVRRAPPRTAQTSSRGRLRPFARGLFDSEYTPTVNAVTNIANARQLAVRGSGGMLIAADMFVFKGKVEATRHPATSVLLRVGVTYDRLWKPRYQPFL